MSLLNLKSKQGPLTGVQSTFQGSYAREMSVLRWLTSGTIRQWRVAPCELSVVSTGKQAEYSSLYLIFLDVVPATGKGRVIESSKNRNPRHTDYTITKKRTPVNQVTSITRNPFTYYLLRTTYNLLNSSAIAAPISAGDSTTRIPHSLMICIFAAAVSSAPPTIAPA